jgi:hypothetical protein
LIRSITIPAGDVIPYKLEKLICMCVESRTRDINPRFFEFNQTGSMGIIPNAV